MTTKQGGHLIRSIPNSLNSLVCCFFYFEDEKKDKCLKAKDSSPRAHTDYTIHKFPRLQPREKTSPGRDSSSEMDTAPPPASSVSLSEEGEPTPECAPLGPDPGAPARRERAAASQGMLGSGQPRRRRRTSGAQETVPAQGAAGRSVLQPPVPGLLGDIPTPKPHTLSYGGSRGSSPFPRAPPPSPSPPPPPAAWGPGRPGLAGPGPRKG